MTPLSHALTTQGQFQRWTQQKEQKFSRSILCPLWSQTLTGQCCFENICQCQVPSFGTYESVPSFSPTMTFHWFPTNFLVKSFVSQEMVDSSVRYVACKSILSEAYLTILKILQPTTQLVSFVLILQLLTVIV